MVRTQSPEGPGLAPYCSSVGLQGKAASLPLRSSPYAKAC